MAILKYLFRSRYRESSSKTINIGNIDKQFTHYKVSFKKNSMSLGLVVLEKKLFTRTPTPQSDDIMSAD